MKVSKETHWGLGFLTTAPRYFPLSAQFSDSTMLPKSFKHLLAILICVPVLSTFAQWESLNPGAGGQIQSIDIDPNIPGRAYYSSDMEGAYRTDDYGTSWQVITEGAGESNTLVIKVNPTDSNHLVMGQINGLEVSFDAGYTWCRTPDIKDPIMFVSYNSENPNEIIAAPGERFRWYEQSGHVSPVGDLGVYRSEDGGKSWTFHSFGLEPGRRDVFTVYHRPSDTSTVLAGSMQGVFISKNGGKNWSQLQAPENTGECWGSCWSPDGKVIFAVYRVPDERGEMVQTEGVAHPRYGLTHLFAKKGHGNWIDLSENGIGFEEIGTVETIVQNNHYWMPECDPEVIEGVYRVALAPVNNRQGLNLVDVSFEGRDIEHCVWKRIFYYENPSEVDFDVGWEHYPTRPLSWEFTPATWPQKGMWTTGDQTLFRGNFDCENDNFQWQNIYTRYVKSIDGVRFYRTRGAQCTFIFDGDAWKNYTAQANGDNAVKESYDGGYSWSVGLRKPRSNSVLILKNLDIPTVIAHTSAGYGASSENGTLWWKKLIHVSPKDEWIKIGGDKEELGGLPDKLYNQIIEDPHCPGRIYIGTRRGGTWLIEDIVAFAAGEIQAVNISEKFGGPLTINDKGMGMVVDPHNPNVLWAIGTTDPRPETGSDLYRGTRNGENWSWEIVRSAESELSQMAAWDHFGKTGLALIRQTPTGDQWIEYSIDGGIYWAKLFNLEDAKKLRVFPEWYHKFPSEFLVKGLTASGSRLAFAYTSEWEQARCYGIFLIDLEENGTPYVSDITGNHPFGYPVKQKFIEVDGKQWLYFASKGAGWWRRPLE